VKETPEAVVLEDLYAARQRYVQGGALAEGVRPLVADSWQRCRDYGLDPDRLRPQPRNPEAHELALERHHELLERAESHLLQVHRTLGDSPHLVALADPEGTILRLLAPPAERAAGAEVNMFEGASWSERAIGCNGVGTAIAAGEQVLLIGPEHFQEAYVGWTCIGVPLRGPDGALAGVLDMSVPNELRSVHTWGWVLSIGRAIERELEHGLAAAQPVIPELGSPFHAVRGVLDLLGQQLAMMPSHAEVLREARTQVDRAEAELREATQSLLAAGEDLRTANRRKDELLATVAHEIRSPLAVISAGVQKLERNAAAPASALAPISRQTDVLARLTADLMDLSRAKRGRLKLLREPVDVRLAARRAAEAAQPELDERGHTFALSLPDHPVCVEGDPVRLQQVVTNLLVNAARYTEPPGHVELTCGIHAGEVALCVRDNGRGLRPRELETLFDPARSAPQRGGGGLGIGLPLVRQLVELHGGSVGAESGGPGLGSSFTVRLPLLPATASGLSASA
jgi:signal transduction histidine kinase